MWLRCQEMRPQDRDWIGGAVPRTDDADPMRMLRALGAADGRVHGVPLVLLDRPARGHGQSVGAGRALRQGGRCDHGVHRCVPNAVVVLACLEDYFKANVEKLTKAKHDRLMHDPEPIRLLGNRTLEEIRGDGRPATRLPVRHGGSGGRPGG